jgi:uncharacterized protein YqjF (DUF2071 family)
MTQRWSNLLFMHWPVATDLLRARVPRPLDVDLYNGTAWLSIASFSLSHLRLRGTPVLPRISAFPELNVRTYVTYGSRPGVYFFSLDAASALAVFGARTLFDLPYFLATMRVNVAADASIDYSSRRNQGERANFQAHYLPHGQAAPADAGSLDRWLVERYCLYTADKREHVYRTDIHHRPWPLQTAHVDVRENTMADAAQIALPSIPPRTSFARQLDVVAWMRERVDRDQRISSERSEGAQSSQAS